MPQVSGWKVANVVVSEALTSVHLLTTRKGLAVEGPYDLEATAVCFDLRHGKGKPPQPYCDCGFNAFKNREDAMNRILMQQAVGQELLLDSMAMVRVALSGEVLETTTQDAEHLPALPGYRAEHQRVKAMFVSRACGFWHRHRGEQEPATGLCIAHYVFMQHYRYVVPTCDNCRVVGKYDPFTLEQLAKLGGFSEVGWQNSLLDHVNEVLSRERQG